MTTSVTQLALRLSPKAVYKFSNYYFCRPEVEAALMGLADSSQADFIYLAADAAVGKTHLSIALLDEYQQQNKRAIYLSFKELLTTAEPAVLQDLDVYQLVCFDNVDLIAGKSDWEEALFHAFNRLKAANAQIVMTAKQSPAGLSLSLPDLASRLATALIFQLPEMTDEEKQAALIKQAKFKGLELDEATAQYLLRQSGRDMHNLMQVLDELDKASLRAQRRLTIPFIRDVTAL